MSGPPVETAVRGDLDQTACGEAQFCGGCFCSSFRADPREVREALRAVIARFSSKITPEEAGTLELALAEVLNNVVEHGYHGLEPGPIALVLRQVGDALHCSIEDRGHAMPDTALTQRPLPAVDVAVADLAEGGWGWALIRELTADLHYSRDGGWNSVRFRIPLKPA